jgi:hypothetical protein
MMICIFDMKELYVVLLPTQSLSMLYNTYCMYNIGKGLGRRVRQLARCFVKGIFSQVQIS